LKDISRGVSISLDDLRASVAPAWPALLELLPDRSSTAPSSTAPALDLASSRPQLPASRYPETLGDRLDRDH